MPAIKRNISSTLMVITFINGILEDPEAIMKIRASDAQAIFKRMLSDIVKNFNLKILYQDTPENSHSAKRARTVDGSPAPPAFHAKAAENDGRNIAHFLINLQNLVNSNDKLDKKLSVIVTRLIRTSEFMSLEYFEIVYFPCLDELIKLLPNTKVEIDGSQFEWLFQVCLGYYIERYVGSKPPANQAAAVTAWEVRRAHAKAQIYRLGIEELRKYIPDYYGAIISADSKGMTVIGSFYSGLYDGASLEPSFFEKDVESPALAEPSRRKVPRQS